MQVWNTRELRKINTYSPSLRQPRMAPALHGNKSAYKVHKKKHLSPSRQQNMLLNWQVVAPICRCNLERMKRGAAKAGNKESERKMEIFWFFLDSAASSTSIHAEWIWCFWKGHWFFGRCLLSIIGIRKGVLTSQVVFTVSQTAFCIKVANRKKKMYKPCPFWFLFLLPVCN